MNWYVIIPLVIASMALIIFLVNENQKDVKEYEELLNSEFDFQRVKDVEDE